MEKETTGKNEEEPQQPNYRGIKVMPLIIGNETFEKLGAIGTMANLLVYLTTVFNLSRITAITILNVFQGTTNFSTLLGAFLSDTYFGRFKTLAFASIASFLGLLMVALTAAIKNLHPPHCEGSKCKGPTSGQMTFLSTGFLFMIIGAAGIRPCNLAFGADQFNPNTESGKRGINSFFNWYFFTMTFAQMVSVTLAVYVQTNVNWGIGLGLPAIFMFISCVLFFIGTNMYVKVRPERSPLTSIVQVVVAAVKKRRLNTAEQPLVSPLFNCIQSNSINSKLCHTDQFRFLDKAAILTEEDKIKADGSTANPWRLCSMQQVEEVKCVFRVMPIWVATIIFHVATAVQHQYVVFQALQSNRHLGKTKFQIPPATYNIFTMLSLTLFVPVYDRILVPSLRKVTLKEGGITILQRIGVGIFLSVVASFVSAFVEVHRRTLALTRQTLGMDSPKSGGVISPMSGFWLVPQLTLTGIADAFTAIGQTEFYYKQLPENMRSVAGSLFFCGTAVSNYLTGLLTSIVHRTTERAATGNWLPEDLNKGRLDCFYYLVTALGVLNTVYFLLCSKWYKYKETGGSPVIDEMT